MTKEEATAFFAAVYCGEHHIPRSGIKPFGLGWAVIHHGDLSTFDFDKLTRMVLLAHDSCYRLAVDTAGMHLRIAIWKRKRVGRICERHPTIEKALADWRERHPVELTA